MLLLSVTLPFVPSCAAAKYSALSPPIYLAVCILCERDEWGREIRAGTCHDNHSFMSALFRMVPPVLSFSKVVLTHIHPITSNDARMQQGLVDFNVAWCEGLSKQSFMVTSACLCACWWRSRCLCVSVFRSLSMSLLLFVPRAICSPH